MQYALRQIRRTLLSEEDLPLVQHLLTTTQLLSRSTHTGEKATLGAASKISAKAEIIMELESESRKELLSEEEQFWKAIVQSLATAALREFEVQLTAAEAQLTDIKRQAQREMKLLELVQEESNSRAQLVLSLHEHRESLQHIQHEVVIAYGLIRE